MIELSALSISIYLLIVSILNGKVPNSISAGYYVMVKKSKSLEPIFFLVMFITGLSLMVYGLDIYGDYPHSYLLFLSGAGLTFVGAASQFKESLVRQIHGAAALVCGISITIWTLIYGSPLLLFLICIPWVLIILIDKKRIVLYIELIAFINAYIQLYIMR